jgi:hypothetical protein
MLGEQHSMCPKFNMLLAKLRDYGGDCRLLVTPIRRGGWKSAPCANRNALFARFHPATHERWASDPESASARTLFADHVATMTKDAVNTDPALQLLRYALAGEMTNRSTGRSRERRHISASSTGSTPTTCDGRQRKMGRIYERLARSRYCPLSSSTNGQADHPSGDRGS